MRRLYKKLIIATIPLAFAISGGAAAIGAALQGLVMWFMLAVMIGAYIYVGVVINLLTTLEARERELVKAYERIRFEQRYPRGTINYR